mmetsp:Transcript_149135/g.273844  ORF Transcript_149135/g.273844 Transcript_149135/m.273844 type:complete len:84 (-) Transcript_149135:518-769(-)
MRNGVLDFVELLSASPLATRILVIPANQLVQSLALRTICQIKVCASLLATDKAAPRTSPDFITGFMPARSGVQSHVFMMVVTW